MVKEKCVICGDYTLNNRLTCSKECLKKRMRPILLSNKNDFTKGDPSWNKGKSTGKTWNKGIPRTQEEKSKISENTKKAMTPEVREKMRKSREGIYVGENHPCWRGGPIPRRRGYDWKLIRKQVLIRYEFKCLHCGAIENIDIHHKIPYREKQEHELENLIPLCKPCHVKEEWRVRKNRC